MKINHEKQFLVAVLCGMVFVGILFYSVVFQRQQDEIRQSRAAIAAADAQITNLEDFFLRHDDLKAYETDLNQQLQFVQKLLPRKMAVADFISATEHMATQSKTVLIGIRPEQPISCQEYFMQTIKITVRGDYFQMLDFLYSMEQGVRFVNVKNMRIHSNDDGYLECQLDVRIYAFSA